MSVSLKFPIVDRSPISTNMNALLRMYVNFYSKNFVLKREKKTSHPGDPFSALNVFVVSKFERTFCVKVDVGRRNLAS